MIPNDRPLVLIPTYNESENVEALFRRILAQGIDLDVLFMDDNSPDGTGEILDRLAMENDRLRVLHRSGKLGIGSAHYEGIKWAYAQGYKILITMDCDFTHPPENIPELLKNAHDVDIVVGSRYMRKDSLKGWNFIRTILTKTGHFLTVILLRLPYDATGAFRLYHLDNIPACAFDLVESKGYSFLYESLFILNFNGLKIREIPIKLPKRTYGHSKMRMSDAWQSLKLLVAIYFRIVFDHQRFEIVKPFVLENQSESPYEKVEWDAYWEEQRIKRINLYDFIAIFYRNFIIRPALNFYIKKHFKQGAQILHAGCGSGQVDVDIRKYVEILALDYSINALNLYNRVHHGKARLLYGSIFKIPLPDMAVEGIYNLGVMEHYVEEDIQKILTEFRRVLKPNGKAVLFWPPEFGLSVIFLKWVHFFMRKILKKNFKLHPDEVCLVRSRDHVENIVRQGGFELIEYYFGLRDFFTCSVVVISRTS